jgi:hypothetical protein
MELLKLMTDNSKGPKILKLYQKEVVNITDTHISCFAQNRPERGEWGNLPQPPLRRDPRPTAFLYLIFIII